MTIQQATDILTMSEQELWQNGYEDTDVEEARNVVIKAHNTRLWIKDIKKYLEGINEQSKDID